MTHIILKDNDGVPVRWVTQPEFTYFNVSGPVSVGKVFNCGPVTFVVHSAGPLENDFQECTVDISASI